MNENHNPNHVEQPTTPVSPATNPIAEPDERAEHPSVTEIEPDREPDMFDNEEYVGVDDESMYMLKEVILLRQRLMMQIHSRSM
jgi:hypothetical protein